MKRDQIHLLQDIFQTIAESVGSISMDVHEGLTGLVLETMKPVFVVNPAEHPRFKYYENSGEEHYQTFLGVPLIYHQQVLGVLVIQTIAADSISEADIPVFENIASQISATVAYTGILNGLSGRAEASEPAVKAQETSERTYRRNYLRGESVSFGVAEGYAHYLPENINFNQVHCTLSDSIEDDIERLESAFKRAAKQIKH